VTDAAVLSTITGGVVVVAGVGLVDRDRLAKSLEVVSGRVLGLVVNRMPTKAPTPTVYRREFARASGPSLGSAPGDQLVGRTHRGVADAQPAPSGHQ